MLGWTIPLALLITRVDQLLEAQSKIRKNLIIIKELLKIMDNKKIIKNEILKDICSSTCLLRLFRVSYKI
jgi:hypothetical protein